MIDDYVITVRRRGTKERVYREVYSGTQHEVERRASDVWSYERYDGQPDIFRLYVHKKGATKAYMTIG